jgi:hypothetical protein
MLPQMIRFHLKTSCKDERKRERNSKAAQPVNRKQGQWTEA